MNFVEGSNPVGIKPPSCNGCGNCTTGCNTTAKTTITVNYLADAKAFGAEIFTEVMRYRDIPLFYVQPWFFFLLNVYEWTCIGRISMRKEERTICSHQQCLLCNVLFDCPVTDCAWCSAEDCFNTLFLV